MDKIVKNVSGYLEKIWNLDVYVRRTKETRKIIDKVGRLIKSRGSDAYVIDYSNESHNVLNLFVRVPENEYSNRVADILSDLEEKISVAKVNIFSGNTLKVRIQKVDVPLPSTVKRFRNGRKGCVPLGLSTETGEEVWLNFKYNPHLLIAGSTGKGKSVALENIILHIDEFFEDAKMVLIDPKRIELSAFQDSQKLLCPIVTEPFQALMKINEVVRMMDDRYRKMEKARTKDFRVLGVPEIFLFVDEYADLLSVIDKSEDEEMFSLEKAIQRITQLGRAAGIHIIIATQRPSVDVVTGVIKNNMPTRIAFGVASAVDSRTILDESGAEKLPLPGYGILRSENGLETFKGVFVSEKERDAYLEAHKAKEPSYELIMPKKPIRLGKSAPRVSIVKIKKSTRITDDRFLLPAPAVEVEAEVVVELEDKFFHGVKESRIREYLSKIEVFTVIDARKDLGLSASQANELGQLLDKLGVVKARGRARHIQSPESFIL